MIRIESSPHDQASAILQSDFNTRVAWHAPRRLRHLHFQEFPRHAFAQPFLPHEKYDLHKACSRHNVVTSRPLLACSETSFRHFVHAFCLFGYVATLRCDTIFHKMGFV
jgi:hypothetical protein